MPNRHLSQNLFMMKKNENLLISMLKDIKPKLSAIDLLNNKKDLILRMKI